MMRRMDKRWIQGRLKDLGKTQSGLAAHLGLASARITEILNGERNVRLAEAIQIAEYLEIPFNDLAHRLGHSLERPKGTTIKVVGRVGAGEELVAIDDYTVGEGFDEIDAPPGFEDAVAVEVFGQSMFPRYRPGDYLIYSREKGLDLENAFGRDCVVALPDGRIYIKLVERGRRKGTVNLISVNAAFPVMLDIKPSWLAPIEWVKPARSTK